MKAKVPVILSGGRRGDRSRRIPPNYQKAPSRDSSRHGGRAVPSLGMTAGQSFVSMHYHSSFQEQRGNDQSYPRQFYPSEIAQQWIGIEQTTLRTRLG